MRKQAINFRHEEVSYITDRWRGSDPCSLVGVGSIGKSNLLQHLADPDVHQKYLGKSPNNFRAIIIDPNLLGPIPTSGDNLEQYKCWAGLELIMHRLYMSFYPFDILAEEDALRFYDAYIALQDGNNPLYAYMGLRHLELGLNLLMRQGIQIVLMFDEFEDMLKTMPVRFFQILRGLRDTYKNQLSYLIFTRSPLPALIKQYNIPYLDIEPFLELFTDNVYYVGPYNSNDAASMLNTLIRKSPRVNHPEYVLEYLLQITGRYAGLMRATFRMLESLGTLHIDDLSNPDLAKRLAQRRPIQAECITIWNSLTSLEQRVLKAVARVIPYTGNEDYDDAIAMLVQKRLLTINPNSEKLSIEPPLFRYYVETNPDSDE